MKEKLIIISAPSGAGKTTIVMQLLESNLNLEFSVSATSRAPRGNEEDGTDYYFFSVQEFKKLVEEDKFIEWEEVYKDHFYGTLKSEIERINKKGNHPIFDVDTKGGINLKKIFGKKALSIFIMPPSVSELEKRLANRGTDSREKIKMRVEKAEQEIKSAKKFDHIVINDEITNAYMETYNLVKSFIGTNS
jgi:guanylate kinase